MKSYIVEAKDITRSYGTLAILKNVSLEIGKGEVVSIVGASGAGKSTLLHILGTLDKADSGSVVLCGTNLNTLTAKSLADFRNKHIGFVFQSHHLLPEFTAQENIMMPSLIAGSNSSESSGYAERLAKILGIAERLNHKPSQLSGGEQQRVAVARALMNKPDIVFADEPTGNLDSKHAHELHELFLKLRDELGQTFLIVTHNEALAAESNRILFMQDGMLQQ